MIKVGQQITTADGIIEITDIHQDTVYYREVLFEEDENKAWSDKTKLGKIEGKLTMKEAIKLIKKSM